MAKTRWHDHWNLNSVLKKNKAGACRRRAQKKAIQMKNVAIDQKAVHKANGVWFKDKNRFINIDEVFVVIVSFPI